MADIEIIEDSQGNEHVKVDNGDGSFTVWVKKAYDEMVAAQKELGGTL